MPPFDSRPTNSPLPFVLDNQQHRMADALNQLLAQSSGKPLDIATAYFAVSGYRLVNERLHQVGAFRLILGAEPHSGTDLGLRPDAEALKRQLQGDLEAEPFNEATLKLVEELIAFLHADKVEIRLYDEGFLHAKAYLFHQDSVGPHNRADRLRPFAAIVGSSNFTGPGLSGNQELNLVHRVILPSEEAVDREAAERVGYLEKLNERETLFDPAGIELPDEARRFIKSEVGARAITDLMNWYERQWADSVDFKDDLIELLDASKFGSKEYTPYEVYTKALYEYFKEELGEDAPELGRSAVDLAEFQEDAVKKARRILARYDGVLIADSVGLVPHRGNGVARKLDMAYLAWSLDCEAGDRPMPGKAAKIIVSERQQVLLQEFSKSRTVAKCVVQRATIILLGFAGLLNEEIASRVGLNRLQVGLWRQRWRDAWDSLCVWECTEPHRLREAIVDVLSDAPRPGAPATFTAFQVSQIVALACEPPKLSGRPIDHWTLRELRDEAIARQIVEDISVSQVGRFLQQAAVQPHRKKMWLNTTEKDPQKFQAEVENVCRTYLEAPAKAGAGTHTVSVDEATSLQAIERNAPDKPAQPNSVPKQEFEYTRHGTTTLTAGLDVVTGMIVCPTLEATRTEAEFVAHITRTVDTDPAAEWLFVVDCLNTHMSESLVKFVAERCGLPDELGKKTTAAS